MLTDEGTGLPESDHPDCNRWGLGFSERATEALPPDWRHLWLGSRGAGRRVSGQEAVVSQWKLAWMESQVKPKGPGGMAQKEKLAIWRP